MGFVSWDLEMNIMWGHNVTGKWQRHWDEFKMFVGHSEMWL